MLRMTSYAVHTVLVTLLLFAFETRNRVLGWVLPTLPPNRRVCSSSLIASTTTTTTTPTATTTNRLDNNSNVTRVTIIGAGWGGLAAAYTLSRHTTTTQGSMLLDITVVDAAPRVGGLVRDGFRTVNGSRPAEAGQHGFWGNYHNIYRLLREDLPNDIPSFEPHQVLTEYAKQGQFSPRGLEAEWPVYHDQPIPLPTGLAQAVYTQFLQLPLQDRLSALPLALAFAEFDDSTQAWERFDAVSFRDLCIRLGVSRRCYQEAFEPMILTGLFAPGAECSAAAALGMAYFFVLQSQSAFDVQWCRGNIGDTIFAPWVQVMKERGVRFECSTRVTGFEIQQQENNNIRAIQCEQTDGDNKVSRTIETDHVILAVGAQALSSFVRFCPELAKYKEWRGFAHLRGTSVLATRLFLDKNLTLIYSANACWGFDQDVGMTMFDIRALHGNNASTVQGCPGSVVEVDYYYANSLLAMSDDDIVDKVKQDLDCLLGIKCKEANVVDAAIVRLPAGVNWYFPGSFKYMPGHRSQSIGNLLYAGDIVTTRHGSWSQEKAFVTGTQAANLVLNRPLDYGVLPVGEDELHVKLAKAIVGTARDIIGGGNRGPSLVDFLW